MKNILIFILFFSAVLFSQEKTELEKFSVKTGIVKIMGYTDIGIVAANPERDYRDYVSFQVRILGTPNNPESTKGILIKVADFQSNAGRAFVDENEIDDLIAGIEYISAVTKDITRLANFEIDYSTLGDFEVTVYNKSDGSLGVSIQAGIRSTRQSLDSLPKILEKIKEAKAILDS